MPLSLLGNSSSYNDSGAAAAIGGTFVDPCHKLLPLLIATPLLVHLETGALSEQNVVKERERE